jgi:ABC-type uncharacterized transport system substrate-binding protein
MCRFLYCTCSATSVLPSIAPKLLQQTDDRLSGRNISSITVPIFRDLSLFVILLSIAFAIPSDSYAKDSNILILLSDNDDVYLDVATTITNSTIKLCRNTNLSCQDANFEIGQISSLKGKFGHEHDHRVIVTLGIKASDFAKQHFSDNLIISALLPKKSNITTYSDRKVSNHYYLYLDQPIQRSLLLISSLSDSFKNIGLLISKNDETTEKILSHSASSLELTLHIEKIDKAYQIGTSLNRLLKKSDILLALPDTRIHNQSTVSNILISAYRKRIPLIGFSSAYVKAGALAAVYSSPEDVAFHVRDNIAKIYSGEKIDENEQNAEYFSILFNSEVARSLDFPGKSVYDLENQMIKRSISRHD